MKLAALQGPLEIGVDYRRYVPASKLDQASPPFFNPLKPNNVGDWFLTKVVDRILDYEELILVQKNAGPAEWDLVNEECDVQPVEGRRLQRLRRTPLDAARFAEEVHELFDRSHSPELVEWLMRHAFFSWDVEEVISGYRSVDLVVGCRLHGNLLALANGTPAYYLTYDERTREVVELLELPGSPIDSLDPELDFAGQDWVPAQRRYRGLYSEMLRFLEGNRLAHRLAPAAEGRDSAPYPGRELELVR